MKQTPFLRKPTIVFVALLALSALANHANAGLVTNGSFESTSAVITSTFQLVTVTGWSDSDFGEAIVLPSWYSSGQIFPGVGLAGAFPQSSPDGGNFVFSDSDYHNSPIVQTITGLNPGDLYQLTFYQSLIEDTELNVTVPGPISGHWQVSLGASVQTSSQMFGDGTTNTFSNWAPQTMTFTATNATELLSFLSVGSGDPPLMGLDGVNLSAAPEPVSIWLMGLGSAMIGWKLRVRRKQS